MEKTIYLGCDPGKQGFFTAFDGTNFTFYAMPEHKVETGELLKSGKPQMKTEFHENGFRNLVLQIAQDFPNCSFKGVMEEVTGRHGWSAQNNFTFGHTAGLQKMVYIMLGAEITMVKPQKWQSYIRQGYPDIRKKSSSGKTMVSDPKAIAEMIVQKEYPNIDFRKTERAKVNHDGKIDSFLICLYGIRRDKQNLK